MSEKSQVEMALLGAECGNYEVVETHGAIPSTDENTLVKIEVRELESADSCKDADAGETDGQEADTTEDARDDDGGSESQDDYEPAVWTVNGTEMGFNALQTAVSEADIPYPDSPTGDKLAEVLSDAATVPESDDSDESDTTSNESDTNADKGEESGANDTQLPHPDEADNPTKEHYIAHFGECENPECDSGSREDSPICWVCENDDKYTPETPKSNRELSELSDAEMTLVSNLMSEGKSKEEAIRMV